MISETPYSAQIMLRKRFLKEASGPGASFDIGVDDSDHGRVLASENALLRTELGDLGQKLESG